MNHYRKASVGLLATISLATLSSPLVTDAAQNSAPPAAAPWTVYTVSMHGQNTGDLVSINGKTGAIESSIPFVAAAPKGLFISPDGTRAYLLSNASYITVLHISGDKPQSVIQLQGEPKAMAMAPDGKTAFVTVGQYVYSVNLSSNQTHVLASFVSPPYGVAVSPDGKTLYVATASTADNNSSTVQLVPVNIATKTASTPINVGTQMGLPASVNLSPDGTTAYVNGSPINIVNLKSGAVTTALMGGQDPGGPFDNLAIDPAGQWIVGENSWWNAVSYFNLKTSKTGDLMDNGPSQDSVTQGLAVTPDGSRIYTTYYDAQDLNPTFNGGIQVLSTTPSGTKSYNKYLLGTIPQGPAIIKPQGLTGLVAVAPEEAPHASFTDTMAPVGQATVFNASSSYGDTFIKSYHWDFGDGTTVDSITPVVKHTYHKAGSYTVTLTVTDEMGATVDNPAVFDGQQIKVNAGSSIAQMSHPVKITNDMVSVHFRYGPKGHVYRAQPTIMSIRASSPWIDLYGLAGHPYRAKLTVLGGTPPYHWQIRWGKLPKGLTFNTKTGLLSGTPKNPWGSYFTLRVTDAHGAVSSAFMNLLFFGKGASECALDINGGAPDIMSVLVRKDPVHKNLTTYISMGALEMDLANLGIQVSWHGKALSFITPNTFTLTGGSSASPNTSHPYSIWINGVRVGTFPNVAKAQNGFGADTFVPIYYLMAAFKYIQGLNQSWDGTTWNITTN